ncbi:ligand-binding SRPBCC domain-containing protein [Catalinimonas alkaloidigena]|uniref:SRPBCC family protein n=1 Tax=Catalinimonas alkaloidigena TaxID=1075417 RepID=UPI0024075117|nr:hypothetical protein [Catalinimonas alkaloidigena]MDF9801247.1 ligand-binding SRPBCC domain-containing protein [Catalinimonas alkaloidigena]
MNIKISTAVEQPYQTVMQGFNEELFMRLNPPFPPVRLLRFDGCKKGDAVALELNFIFFKQQWLSKIVEDDFDQEEFYFIDKGTRLPFFLKYWHHRHRIIKNSQGSTIVDDITFKSPSPLLDFLLWPVLWLQFLYRKPIYKKIFSSKGIK